MVGVSFGVPQWQFIIGEQYELSLVFSFIGSKGRSEDFPVNILEVARCPLILLLEIVLKGGEIDLVP